MSQHVTDFSKAPLNIILDLINHDHGTSLTTNEITIDAPVATSDNFASIVVRAVPGSGYRGQQTLNYSRIPLNMITGLEGVQTFYKADVTTTLEVLNAFNAKYGLSITPSEVTIDDQPVGIHIPYNQSSGTDSEILIKAKDSSYVWHGQTIFRLTTEIQLSEVLLVTELNGLWMPSTPHADIPEGKYVATTEINGELVGDIRVTDEGHIRVFVI